METIETVALPEDVVAAIGLALEAAATPEAACEVIDRLVRKAGTLDESRTQPTKLLVDAVRESNASFTVNV